MANLQASTFAGMNFGSITSIPATVSGSQTEYPTTDVWNNFTSLSPNLSVKKIGDWVDFMMVIDGIVSSSAIGYSSSSVLYTLPTGYRPTGISTGTAPTPYNQYITTGTLRIAGQVGGFGGTNVRQTGTVEVRINASGEIKVMTTVTATDAEYSPGSHQIGNNNSWLSVRGSFYAGTV
jgi:hypothetical protein